MACQAFAELSNIAFSVASRTVRVVGASGSGLPYGGAGANSIPGLLPREADIVMTVTTRGTSTRTLGRFRYHVNFNLDTVLMKAIQLGWPAPPSGGV